jgi:HlyD family secretion protein
MSGLFRQVALDKISNPDQLDRSLQIVRPLHWLGIWTLSLIILGGFAWSLISTAPVTVQGQGLLLSTAGVMALSARSEGQVEAVLAKIGSRVEAGQSLVRLQRFAVMDAIAAKQAQLEGAQNQLRERIASYEQYQQMQGGLKQTKRESIDVQLEQLKNQRQIQTKRIKDMEALLTKGFTTSNKLNDEELQLSDIENRIARLGSDRIDLEVQQKGEDLRHQQEIREAELRADILRHELLNMEQDYERNRILVSPVAATLAEFTVNPGDLVSTGQVLARILPDQDTDPEAHHEASLHAIIFVPNKDGKRIRPGMAAQVMPSTTRLQKDGFMLARVVDIAPIASSREAIMRRLNSPTLVESLLQLGAPFEIELDLELDPKAPSGYRWSSGKGPNISIETGTFTTAEVVVERKRIISLALPSFDYIFRWLGVQ